MGQPNLDFRKIRDRTADIRSSVAELRELISQPPEAFSADRRNVYATAHLFLVAIEAVASICNHILSRLAHRAPTSYSECFESLGDLGVIPKDLAKELIPMARFRNLLVHRYWEFQDQELYRYTKDHLRYFEEFLKHLTRWLENQGDSTNLFSTS